MLTAAASPLVSGGRPDNTMNAKTRRCKVLRPFLLRLDRQEVGKEIEIDRSLAMELASCNKVELLPPATAAAVVSTVKPPEPAKGKAAKES